MNKSRLGALSIITLLLISISLATAQYPTEKVTDVTIGFDGTFAATEPSVGISYVIKGEPGTMGTVTATIYTGNPQTTASIPEGVSLTRFVAITFDIDPSFTSAEITISYSDSDVAGMDQPYAVYKYLPGNDSFVELPTTADASAKTLTVTLSSVDDPLLAIGSLASDQTPTVSTTTWIIISVAIVIIVLLALFLVLRWRRM